MKNTFIVFILVGGLLLATAIVRAEHHEHQGTKMEEPQENIEAMEVGNKICPVSGEKVGGAMGDPFKVEYNGKIYNLCCAMCEGDFLKNPEKYSKIAEAEVKAKEEE